MSRSKIKAAPSAAQGHSKFPFQQSISLKYLSPEIGIVTCQLRSQKMISMNEYILVCSQVIMLQYLSIFYLSYSLGSSQREAVLD